MTWINRSQKKNTFQNVHFMPHSNSVVIYSMRYRNTNMQTSLPQVWCCRHYWAGRTIKLYPCLLTQSSKSFLASFTLEVCEHVSESDVLFLCSWYLCSGTRGSLSYASSRTISQLARLNDHFGLNLKKEKKKEKINRNHSRCLSTLNSKYFSPNRNFS